MKNIFRKNFILPAVIILVILPAGRSCLAQRLYAPNSIYMELAGNGLIYSINYDRMFTENMGGRIGVMYFPLVPSLFSSVEDLFIMPATLNFLIGSNSHKLEMGAGIIYGAARLSTVFSSESESGSGLAQTITIGYRYQQRSGGFLFRIGFTPIFRFGEEFIPWGGFSVGVSF
jgi:hypothetical protein